MDHEGNNLNLMIRRTDLFAIRTSFELVRLGFRLFASGHTAFAKDNLDGILVIESPIVHIVLHPKCLREEEVIVGGLWAVQASGLIIRFLWE